MTSKEEVLQQLDETIIKMSVAIDMLKELKTKSTFMTGDEIMQALIEILMVKMDVQYQEQSPSIIV